jgi:hypothetical protein
VLKAIEEGKIPATQVIRIMDESKRMNPKRSLVSLVKEAIAERKQNSTIMQSQGLSKMTIKSRIQAFTEQLKDAQSENAKLLLDFAQKLNHGAPISELVAMAQNEK